MKSAIIAIALIAGLLIAPAYGNATTGNKLESYNVDLKETSVSGISSGAYMAVQFGIAYSSIIKGVGAIAGGPYYCSQNSMNKATRTCMIGSPDVGVLLGFARQLAKNGAIDPLSNVANQKVWLFNGYNDGVVRRPVTNALYDFYKELMPESSLYYQTNLNASHAQITSRYGHACDFTGDNFMVNCEYDAAGLILQHIYGRLNLGSSKPLSGTFIAFDQREFLPKGALFSGLAEKGYVYVPARCANKEPCKVHVAFHGCKQYAGSINDEFYKHAGYNEWADANDIIVLYPQTIATMMAPLNPNGCWDWWGYTNRNYETRKGMQISAIKSMLDRLARNYKTGTSISRNVIVKPQDITGLASSDTRSSIAWRSVAAATGYNVYRAPCADCRFTKINAKLIKGPSYGDHGLTPKTQYFYKVRWLDRNGRESDDSMVVNIATAAVPAACDPFVRDNVTHVNEQRAYLGLDGKVYAYGSNAAMGPWNIFVESALRKISDNYYEVGPCGGHERNETDRVVAH